MLSPRQVIEDIRRREYGVGLPAGSSEAAVIRGMRAKLERAVRLLAGELYAEGIHFVLELLQNAEDGEYDDWDAPFFRLVRRPDHLLVQYNEVGFREEDVRSLCDISRSTKSKAAGQIGEKGVGFKSVFRVSDNPQVFSAGYGFGFRSHDAETGLGYVVPYWIDGPPPCVQSGLTNIYLPLRGDAQGEVARIADLEPSVLLFLKKLVAIEIIDEVAGRTRRVTRTDKGHNVELRDGERAETWRVFAARLPVPAGCRDDRREGVEETEVALAFPLTSEGAADASRKPRLHAFLPVRPCGFRFVVQADFVLASSREEVLKDRPWNLWLRDRIPEVFLRAAAESREDAGLRNTFLSFLPLAGDLEDEFWKPVSERTIALLKEDACVLVEPSRWARPDQAITASEAARSLFPGEAVRKLLGRDLVATEFQHATESQHARETLRTLGVAAFGMTEVIRFLSWGQWLCGRQDEWFGRLFAFLDDRMDHHVRPRLEEVRKTRLVPLEDGELASPAEGAIFLPLDRRAAYGFEHTLRVVRRAALPSNDGGKASAARRCLLALGVAKPEPAELIEQHLLPLLAGRLGSPDDAALVGAALYVKDHLAEYEKKDPKLAKLKEVLLLKAGPDGPLVRPAELYLPAAYGNANGLESLFAGIDGIRFVAEDYLECALRRLPVQRGDGGPSEPQRKREARAWRDFLVRLGVEEWPRVAVQPPAANAPARAWSDDLRKVFDTRDRSRITQAFGLIDRRWAEYRRLLAVPERRKAAVGQPPANVPSDFSRLLTNAEWLPVKGGGLARPADTFLDTPANRQLLGDRVCYLEPPAGNRLMLDDLGIRREPDTAAALARLKALAGEGACDRDALARLYGFLHRRLATDREAIVEAFVAGPLVCVPGPPARYLPLQEVFWEDVPPALGKCGGLGRHWPALEAFFVQSLGVRPFPSAEDHGRLLWQLASRGQVQETDRTLLWALYEGLGHALAREGVKGEGDRPAWWERLVRHPVFLTDRGDLRPSDGSLFVNDTAELYEVFRGRPEVFFLQLPGDDYPRFHRLIEAARIPMLSRSVKVEAAPPIDRALDAEMTHRARAAVPFLLRYLYFKDQAAYKGLEQAGVPARLAELAVYACGEVWATVSLNRASVRQAADVASCFPAVFVRRCSMTDTDTVAVELARLLGDPPGLASLLGSLLSRPDAQAMERLMKAHKIPAWPAELGPLGDAGGRQMKSQPAQGISSATAHAAVAEDPDEDTADMEAEGDGQADGLVTGEPADQRNQTPKVGPQSSGRVAARGGTAAPGNGNGGGGQTGQNERPTPTHQDAAPGWSPTCLPWEASVSSSTLALAAGDGSPERGQRGGVTHAGRYFSDGTWAEDAVTDSPHARAIGRWGEGYVVECLRNELLRKYRGAASEEKGDGFRIILDGRVVAEVTWLNTEEDQGAGHDIEVVEGEARWYVEVKSTAGNTRCSFEMTEAQWRLAGQAGSAYCIARVFHAGKAEARVAYVIDPVKEWLKGQLAVRVLRVVL